MCVVNFDPCTRALPQLRYGFAASAYQSAHMNYRNEQSVANLYVWLPRQVLHLYHVRKNWYRRRGTAAELKADWHVAQVQREEATCIMVLPIMDAHKSIR